MGGIPFSKKWFDAITYAYSQGVIIVAAAGNYLPIVVYPARYKHVIGVAGSKANNTPWLFSGKGSEVTISATAANVYVADTTKRDNYLYGYNWSFGTSMATPHVAASAALWLNYYKKELSTDAFTKEENKHRIVDTFMLALQKSANTFGNKWDKKNYGAGVLNALDLLDHNPQHLLLQPGMRSDVGEPDTSDIPPLEKLAKLELSYIIGNIPLDEPRSLAEIVEEKATDHAKAYFKENIKEYRSTREIYDPDRIREPEIGHYMNQMMSNL